MDMARDMEDFPIEEDWAKDIKSDDRLQKMNDDEMSNAEPDGPPDGFQFVLPFLDLKSRFNVERLNKSLKEAVKDPLVWADLRIGWLLGKRLSNKRLLKLVERANGLLKNLFLMYAYKITDETLSRIFELNPGLERISVPECTGLSAEKLVSLVEAHSLRARAKGLPGIRQVRLSNVGGLVNSISPQHLLRLESVLGVSKLPQDEAWSSRRYYGKRGNYSYDYSEATDKRPVDVELCPDCKQVKLVFDCPSLVGYDSNDFLSSEHLEWVFGLPAYDCSNYVSCRSCIQCTLRCVGCGTCFRPRPDDSEFDENMMHSEYLDGGLVCSSCWPVLPKCDRCGRRACFPDGSDALCGECYHGVHRYYSSDEEDL